MMQYPLILVTGATGTLGSEVVRHLVAARQRVRALMRTRSKAAFDPSVEVVVADLAEPETLAPAFAGVDKALVVANGPDLETLEANAFAAAKGAGVKHIVKVSGRHVDAEFLEGSVLARWHNRSESRLRALGTRWTIVRPAMLASNVAMWLNTKEGILALPAGNGKDTLTDPRDIAAVIAHVLAEGGHDGALYELTGPQFVSFGEAVGKLGAAVGRPLRFIDVPRDAARAGMIAAGLPSSQADAVLMLFDGIKAGKAYPPTATIADLLGRPARTFDEWLADHADALRARLNVG
jgi:uncharacterized protein YbjT (DUF2867 family)